MRKNESKLSEYFRINLNNTRSGDHYVPPRNRLALSFNQRGRKKIISFWLLSGVGMAV